MAKDPGNKGIQCAICEEVAFLKSSWNHLEVGGSALHGQVSSRLDAISGEIRESVLDDGLEVDGPRHNYRCRRNSVG